MKRELVSSVQCVLEKCLTAVTPAGPSRWSCVLQNGALLPMEACLDDDFLQFVVAPDVGVEVTQEDLLRANAKLGPARFALAPESNRPVLRSEIVVDGEAPLLPRVRDALSSLHDGCALPAILGTDSPPEEESASAGSNSIELIRELLRETPWTSGAREGTGVAIPLDGEFGPHASVEPAHGGYALSAKLVSAEDATATSCRALALMLLTLTGALRLASACSTRAGVETTWQLRVWLPATASAAELDQGMAALSTAYQMCAREAEVLLLNQAAATTYIAVRNTPAAVPTRKENCYG